MQEIDPKVLWDLLYLRAYSQSECIATAPGLLDAMRALWSGLGIEAVEYSTGYHPFLRCSGAWMKRIIPKREQGGATVLTSEGITFSFRWMPPEDPLAQFASPDRNMFSFEIPTGFGWQRSVVLLKETVTHLDAFWGELNDCRIIERGTFCSGDSHKRTIPHIGMMNYWGPDYIDIFGGRQLIEDAGFETVSPHHQGVLVSVGSVQNRIDFERRQADIESRLEEADFWSQPIRQSWERRESPE